MDLASPWISSQLQPISIWKVTKADTMTFLVIFVAPKPLVWKSPQGGPLSPRTLGANWQVTQRLLRPWQRA